MIDNNLYVGINWNKTTENELNKKYPCFKLSKTKGTRYKLSEDKCYLVRIGEFSVIMPRMIYSKEAGKAFLHLYGED